MVKRAREAGPVVARRGRGRRRSVIPALLLVLAGVGLTVTGLALSANGTYNRVFGGGGARDTYMNEWDRCLQRQLDRDVPRGATVALFQGDEYWRQGLSGWVLPYYKLVDDPRKAKYLVGVKVADDSVPGNARCGSAPAGHNGYPFGMILTLTVERVGAP